MAIREQKQNKFFCKDEKILFNFLGTKIIIFYIFKDEKNYLTLKFNNTIQNIYIFKYILKYIQNNKIIKNLLSKKFKNIIPAYNKFLSLINKI